MRFYVLLRFFQIGAVAALVGVRLWALRWSRSRAPAERRALLGHALAGGCERLGPSFVKIAQFLSTRPDLLDDEIRAPLARLQDQVRPVPRRQFRRWVTRALRRPIESVFSEFSERPIAAGSVSEVYLARRRDSGEWVAVKVQRPRIRHVMSADLRLVRAGVRLMERLRRFQGLPLLEAVRHAGDCLERQLDFEAERRVNTELRALFADGALIRIPRIDAVLSNDRALVMEFIDGMIRLDDRALEQGDFRRAADLLLHIVYRMLFVGGVVHCDLHPANVYATARGELVVLDPGLSARLTDKQRRSFARLFRALAFNEADTCVEVLRELSSREPTDFEPKRFEADVRAVLDDAARAPAGDFSVGRFAYALFECQRRHRLAGSPDFVMAIWALLTVEGLLKSRWPDLDFQRKAIPYLTGVLVSSLAS